MQNIYELDGPDFEKWLKDRHQEEARLSRLRFLVGSGIMVLSALSICLGFADDNKFYEEINTQVDQDYPNLSRDRINEAWEEVRKPAVLRREDLHVSELTEKVREIDTARGLAVGNTMREKRELEPARYNAQMALIGTGWMIGGIYGGVKAMKWLSGLLAR